MTISNWEHKDQFGLIPRDVQFHGAFAAAILVENGPNVPEATKNALFALYQECLDEQLPMFNMDKRYERHSKRVKDKELSKDAFEADLGDAEKIIVFASPATGLVGYLLMSARHHILSLYVRPSLRRDRVATSLLELYLNRFGVKELTANPYALDKRAIAFLHRLGFENNTGVSGDYAVVPVSPVTLDFAWKAKQ